MDAIKTVLVYTIPATGHVFAMLAMVEALVHRGFRVLVYSTEGYRAYLQEAGAGFVAYDLDAEAIDLKDGSRLLKFRRLVLEYTTRMLEGLLRRAEAEQPCLIIHDAAAHWGKRVGETLQVPAIAFCSFVTAGGYFSPSAMEYALRFLRSTLADLGELAAARRYVRQLSRRYGYRGWDLMSVLLSRQRLNVMSYARALQPGGQGFGEGFFFMGPCATLRKRSGGATFAFSRDRVKIYISLGTIFKDNGAFFHGLMLQLNHLAYEVYLSADSRVVQPPQGGECRWIIRDFFDQQSVLEHMDLCISAGGINSISECLRANVPCLMFPMQGEQRMCCNMVEKLGFGLIARKQRPLAAQIEKALSLRQRWDHKQAAALSQVHMELLLEKIETYIGGA